MLATKSPEKLPSGWTEHVKVLKNGREIRYYTNLETDEKFFFKEDLLHHAKMESTQCTEPQPTTEKHKMHTQNNRMPVDETNEQPEWLPDGWTMELKTRKSGARIGTEYKIYIDPSTGFRFYSKPEVLRHLKSVKRKPSALKQKKIGINLLSNSKVLDEKSEVDDLPPGWMREIKIRKNAHGTKRDMYYTDPVSGYVFRSKKDVLLYLETGEIRKRVSTPKKRKSDVENNGETLSSFAVKRQKQKHPASGNQLFAGRGSSTMITLALPEAQALKTKQGRKISSESAFAAAPMAKILPKKHVMDNMMDKGANEKENYSVTRSPQPKTECSTSNQGKGFSADNRPVSVLVADIPQNSFGSGSKRSQRNNTLDSSSKSGEKKKLNVPCRSSKRLAGLKPELMTNFDLSERALKKELTGAHGSDAIKAAGSTPERSADIASLKAGLKYELADNTSTSITFPLNGESLNKSKELHKGQTVQGALNKNKEPLKGQTVRGEKTKCLGTEENYYDNSKSQLSLPLGESCSNPGRESAVRTLTGSVPVDDTGVTKSISTPAADILQEKTLLWGMDKSTNSKSQIKPSNSTNRKKLNLPCRFSKRLAGFEAEPVANSTLSERVLGKETADARRSDVIEAPGSSSHCLLADEAPQQLEADLKLEIAHNISTGTDSSLLGEHLAKNKELLEDQTVQKEEPKVRVLTGENHENSDSQLFFPFEKSWSDPCIEFAIKTLTGAIPVDYTANTTSGPNSAADILQKKTLDGRMEKKTKSETHVKLRKATKRRELNLPCRSSKRVVGLEPKLATNSEATEAVRNTARHSSESEAILGMGLNSISLEYETNKQLTVGLESNIAVQGSRDAKALLHEESIYTNRDSLKGQPVPQNVENGKMTDDKPEAYASLPFRDLLSDPCLEFAFKTLTGAIPVDDDLAIQGYFQQQLNNSRSGRDSSLANPDFSSPGFLQNDISSHFNAPEKQSESGQKLPVNPSFIHPGNASVPSCSGRSGISHQQPCLPVTKDVHGRVKS